MNQFLVAFSRSSTFFRRRTFRKIGFDTIDGSIGMELDVNEALVQR